jgi:hypothetical protein
MNPRTENDFSSKVPNVLPTRRNRGLIRRDLLVQSPDFDRPGSPFPPGKDSDATQNG